MRPRPGRPDTRDAPKARTPARSPGYGPYVCWFDADTTDVEVFTEGGTWVGTAPEPNDLGELLEAFEHQQAAGGEQ
ncbi:hypothetical protein ACFV8E_32485 [Streptomyces sp. NPDC059849]|uniref:hypothetical protein n=1 Tax=Streptomyces sp. NPDC059849 TaxID=3346969 RepID=UPI003646AF87